MAARAKITSSPRDTWEVAYFQRHKSDDKTKSIPGREYLQAVPKGVRAHMQVVIVAVAAAPPDKFAGGGYWEAMHGEMTGYFEVRKKVRGMHYRLFCILDDQASDGQRRLVILCGMTKPDRTTFTKAEYAGVRELGTEYRARNPRSLA